MRPDKIYTVISIIEPDFGCEGRPEGDIPKDQVFLEDENGDVRAVLAEDKYLYEKGIDEDTEVWLDDDLILHTMDELPKTVDNFPADGEFDAWIAPGAVVLGDVTIGEGSSVWYNATVRADVAPVRIGKGSNIQDNAVVHVEKNHPAEIGDHVTVGHSAIVHGAKVGDGSLIGMGAILLNGSCIGKECVIGAGTLVPQGKIIPDRSMAYGSPVQIVRQLSEEEVRHNYENAQLYVEEAEKNKM